MKQIILTTEDETKREEFLSISDKCLNNLEILQYSGGFKRFDICLFDDKSNLKRTEKTKLINFLTLVFGENAIFLISPAIAG